MGLRLLGSNAHILSSGVGPERRKVPRTSGAMSAWRDDSHATQSQHDERRLALIEKTRRYSLTRIPANPAPEHEHLVLVVTMHWQLCCARMVENLLEITSTLFNSNAN